MMISDDVRTEKKNDEMRENGQTDRNERVVITGDMNNGVNGKTSVRLPNTAFDMEYSTQVKREYYYLKDRGFRPSFVYHTHEYNIPTYKYVKTPELFLAVADFYNMKRKETQAAKQQTFEKKRAKIVLDDLSAVKHIEDDEIE